jgi:hypothetical protein
MVSTDDSQRSEQRTTILRYLAERPNAGDTVDGVVQWWLPLQRCADAREMVESILEELVAEGLVVRSSLIDGTVMYSANDHSSTDD